MDAPVGAFVLMRTWKEREPPAREFKVPRLQEIVLPLREPPFNVPLTTLTWFGKVSLSSTWVLLTGPLLV